MMTAIVVEPEYRGKGMQCKYYLNWPGRQLLFRETSFCVVVIIPLDERRAGAAESDSIAA